MDGQGTKCRRNIAENFNRLSRAHERYRRQTDRVTDRQTDRLQTDGRATANSERERSLLAVYIGDSDVISSHQLFSAILWGKLCETFVILTSADVTFSIR